MKKWWLVLLGAGLFTTAVFAGNDIPVQVKELPDAARTFLDTEFRGIQVASATMEQDAPKSYEVTLVDGTQIDFDAHGHWTEVKCRNSVVPATLVPRQIQEFVKRNNPDQAVVNIERKGREGRLGYEIELTDGTELDFNRDLRLVGMDR